MRIESPSMDVGSFTKDGSVPKVAGKRQGNLNKNGSDHKEPLPQGAASSKDSARLQEPDKLDLNGDGVVSPAEGIRGDRLPNQVEEGPENGGRIKNRILEQVLKGLDTNGDGIVSQTESIQVASRYNIVASLYQDQNDIQNGGNLRISA